MVEKGPDPTSPGESLDLSDQVIEAADRTLRAGMTRVVWQQPLSDSWLHFMGRTAPRGCNPASPFFWGMRLLVRRMPEDLTLTRTGWVDFVHRRYELEQGGWILRVDRRHRYAGPSYSRLRRRRRSRSESARDEPLWLIELLRGAVAAEELGEAEVGGLACRHFGVVANFERAAATSQCGLARPLRVPRGKTADELGVEPWDGKELQVDVFVDPEGRVRRVHVRGFLLNITMDLLAFEDTAA